MRCGKEASKQCCTDSSGSQPARMRCGKVCCSHSFCLSPRRNPHECAVAKPAVTPTYTQCIVATRTNALWQSGRGIVEWDAVEVATRTNALWQRTPMYTVQSFEYVATRTNALWQSVTKLQALMSLLRRNPRECAVAKVCALWKLTPKGVATRTNALWQRLSANASGINIKSQPARMRCGKDQAGKSGGGTCKSQPARMRCGKELGNRQGAVHCAVATRANALWQRSSHAWMLTTTAGRNPRECAVAKTML